MWQPTIFYFRNVKVFWPFQQRVNSPPQLLTDKLNVYGPNPNKFLGLCVLAASAHTCLCDFKLRACSFSWEPLHHHTHNTTCITQSFLFKNRVRLIRNRPVSQLSLNKFGNTSSIEIRRKLPTDVLMYMGMNVIGVWNYCIRFWWRHYARIL